MCCLCIKHKKRRQSNKERPSVNSPAADLENSSNKFIDINFIQASRPPSNVAEASVVSPKPIIRDSKFSFGGANLKVPLSNNNVGNYASKESPVPLNPSINLNININVYNKIESSNKDDSKPQHLSFVDTLKTGNFNKISTNHYTISKPQIPKEKEKR